MAKLLKIILASRHPERTELVEVRRMLPKSVIFEVMRKTMKYFLTIFLFSPLVAISQISPEQIIKYKIHSTDKVSPQTSDDVYVISAPYGKPILTAATLQEIKNKQVIAVELVYTKFRRSESFNQEKLNLNRFQNLKKILPTIFKSNSIDWKITEQTGATDYNTGQAYFHGFIIGTRAGKFTAKDREAELKEMEKAIDGDGGTEVSGTGIEKKYRDRNLTPTYDLETVKYYNMGAEFTDDPCELVDDAVGHIEYPSEAQIRKISGRVQAQFTVNKNGDVQDIKITEGIGFGCEDAVKKYLQTMPKWKPARDKQGAVSSYVTLNFWFIMNPDIMPASEMPCDLIIIVPKGSTVASMADTRNNVVSEIFSRNKNWNNVAVVCDATGSMGPYMSDLMKWFRMNVSRIKYFTFFNDGDLKSDGQKAIGNTGGLYNTPAIGYEAVEKEMYTAMRNGFGGDLPENDVEALLEAQNNAPFAERLIWIADNYATPRDIALLPKITKPVSIIICSSQNMVSTDYLNIAYKIKASVHTLTADLPNISAMNDGEKVTIDGREYQLVGEKFYRTY